MGPPVTGRCFQRGLSAEPGEPRPDPVRSVFVERRIPALTILAITFLCAALGLFETVGGVLILTPFLVLVLPLLAGFDPADPVIEKLIGILGLDHTGGSSRSRPDCDSIDHPLHGRIVAGSLRSRGPPLPVVS